MQNNLKQNISIRNIIIYASTLLYLLIRNTGHAWINASVGKACKVLRLGVFGSWSWMSLDSMIIDVVNILFWILTAASVLYSNGIFLHCRSLHFFINILHLSDNKTQEFSNYEFNNRSSSGLLLRKGRKREALETLNLKPLTFYISGKKNL